MKRTNPYKQGYYVPTNSKKYIGTQPIIYRSGLELLFYRWCDRNEKIIEWGSESVVLPYVSPKDGKIHRYFVDGNVTFSTPNGLKKYLIEIKPSSQTREPKAHGKKKRSTLLYEQVQWAVNSKKWLSAKKWCEKNGYNFLIITEKDLK